MREVIEEILDTEKKANGIIEDARAAATQLKEKTEAEAARLVAAARERAQAILKEETQRAREEAREAHVARGAKADEENRAFLERQEPNVLRLVDRVAALILTPEHAKS